MSIMRALVDAATRGDVVPRAGDRHAADAQPLLARVVVDDGDGQVRALGIAHHRGDDLRAALAGTDDQQARRLIRGRLRRSNVSRHV